MITILILVRSGIKFTVLSWVGAGLLRLSVGSKIGRQTRPYRILLIIGSMGEFLRLFVNDCYGKVRICTPESVTANVCSN